MNKENTFYINLMLESIERSKSAPDLYRPTSFWNEWAQKLFDDMQSSGFEKFKETSACLSLFVAHYGHPFNEISDELRSEIVQFSAGKGIPKKQVEFLDFYLSGKMNALSDYRVLAASDTGPSCGLDFSKFSEGDIGSPLEQFEYDGRVFSRSSLNYLHQLTFLRKHMGDFVPSTFLEIGGGWGSLGEVLMKTATSQIKYIDIDIPPTNSISEYYLRKTFPTEGFAGFHETNHDDEIAISDLPSLSVLPSWKIEKLCGEIDVFVNAISFQEMEPSVVQNYLDKVAGLKPKFLMLRNLREGKNAAPTVDIDNFVLEPVKREFYIKCLQRLGYELTAENVIPFGRKMLDGFHSEILVFRAAK